MICDHIVRDIHPREKRTGHRIHDNKPFFEDVAKAIADAGAILIVGPAQEKDDFAKFLTDNERHPAIRTHVRSGREEGGPPDRRRAPRPRAPLRQSRRPHAAADVTPSPCLRGEGGRAPEGAAG